MTLLCGIEDPVGPNEQLYTVASSGQRELARFTVEGAARCTLLSVGSDPEEIRTALVRGVAWSGARLTAVDAWFATAEPVQELARYRDATLHNLDVAGGKTYLAAIAVERASWPLIADASIARRALLVHEEPVLEILEGLPAGDAHEWGRRGPAPSEALIEWLRVSGAAICYPVRDGVGRIAAIIVGARAIVDSFASVDVTARYENARASLVLRVGLSGAAP